MGVAGVEQSAHLELFVELLLHIRHLAEVDDEAGRANAGRPADAGDGVFDGRAALVRVRRGEVDMRVPAAVAVADPRRWLMDGGHREDAGGQDSLDLVLAG